MSFHVIILLTLLLVAINSAVLGSYLMVNKMSMIGDALSHSVLPGIVVAFLITQEHHSFVTSLFGAGLGLFAVFAMNFLSQRGGLKKDAAIGIIYTLLFSVGIILISSLAKNADIDAECVIFGDLGNVPFQEYKKALGIELPVQTWILLLFLIFNLTILLKGAKGFNISIFDAQHARAMGINTVVWSYSLLCLTSLSTVFSFESVGAIMVISLLVIPAGFARILTNRMRPMIAIAVTFSAVCSFIGYFCSLALNINIVACIAALMGSCLLTLVIFKAEILLKQQRKNKIKAESLISK